MVRVRPRNLITHGTQWMKMNYGYIFSRMNHTDNRIQPRPSSSRTEKINSRWEIRLLYTVKKMSWGVHKQPSVLFLNRDMVEWAHFVINLFNHTTVVWILVLSQNSYVGNLTSGVIALRDGPSWGRWLLIRWWRRRPHGWDWYPDKRGLRILLLSLPPCGDTVRRCQQGTTKRGLATHQTCWPPDLGLPDCGK